MSEKEFVKTESADCPALFCVLVSFMLTNRNEKSNLRWAINKNRLMLSKKNVFNWID